MRINNFILLLKTAICSLYLYFFYQDKVKMGKDNVEVDKNENQEFILKTEKDQTWKRKKQPLILYWLVIICQIYTAVEIMIITELYKSESSNKQSIYLIIGTALLRIIIFLTNSFWMSNLRGVFIAYVTLDLIGVLNACCAAAFIGFQVIFTKNYQILDQADAIISYILIFLMYFTFVGNLRLTVATCIWGKFKLMTYKIKAYICCIFLIIIGIYDTLIKIPAIGCDQLAECCKDQPCCLDYQIYQQKCDFQTKFYEELGEFLIFFLNASLVFTAQIVAFLSGHDGVSDFKHHYTIGIVGSEEYKINQNQQSNKEQQSNQKQSSKNIKNENNDPILRKQEDQIWKRKKQPIILYWLVMLCQIYTGIEFLLIIKLYTTSSSIQVPFYVLIGTALLRMIIFLINSIWMSNLRGIFYAYVTLDLIGILNACCAAAFIGVQLTYTLTYNIILGPSQLTSYILMFLMYFIFVGNLRLTIATCIWGKFRLITYKIKTYFSCIFLIGIGIYYSFNEVTDEYFCQQAQNLLQCCDPDYDTTCCSDYLQFTKQCSIQKKFYKLFNQFFILFLASSLNFTAEIVASLSDSDGTSDMQHHFSIGIVKNEEQENFQTLQIDNDIQKDDKQAKQPILKKQNNQIWKRKQQPIVLYWLVILCEVYTAVEIIIFIQIVIDIQATINLPLQVTIGTAFIRIIILLTNSFTMSNLKGIFFAYVTLDLIGVLNICCAASFIGVQLAYTFSYNVSQRPLSIQTYMIMFLMYFILIGNFRLTMATCIWGKFRLITYKIIVYLCCFFLIGAGIYYTIYKLDSSYCKEQQRLLANFKNIQQNLDNCCQSAPETEQYNECTVSQIFQQNLPTIISDCGKKLPSQQVNCCNIAIINISKDNARQCCQEYGYTLKEQIQRYRQLCSSQKEFYDRLNKFFILFLAAALGFTAEVVASLSDHDGVNDLKHHYTVGMVDNQEQKNNEQSQNKETTKKEYELERYN